MTISTRRRATALVVAIALAACGTSAPAAPTGPGAQESASVLRAYTALSGNPSRSFHLLQTGSYSVGVQTVDIRYELDVAGADLRGLIKLGPQTIELVVVDAVTYAKVDGAWSTMPADADLTRDILDVFRYVGDTANLRFLARLDEPGGPVFYFRAINPLPYQTVQMREAGVTGSITELDFYVRSDGVPVRVSFVSSAEQGKTRVSGRSSIEFSRWGEPIVIEAPF